MKKFKKLIAVLLVIVMCACYAPMCSLTSSAADEPAAEATEALDETLDIFNFVMSIVETSIKAVLGIVGAVFPEGEAVESGGLGILDVVLNAVRIIYGVASQAK